MVGNFAVGKLIDKPIKTEGQIKKPEIPGPNIDNLNLSKEKDTEKPNEITTRNQGLEGTPHPETGVPFERKIIDTDEGKKEGVFPVFESKIDVQLPEELEKANDSKQFDYSNKKLKEEIENNPEMRNKFSKEQLEQINDLETPDGYTWHHSEDKGKMQLVDSKTHSQTGHTGGKVVWGGGNENR